MSDDEDYDSAEDQDYVPTDGEEVSEEENSGDEENLDLLKEDGETGKITKKRRSPKKAEGPRKRIGGIKLAEEDPNTVEKEESDNFNKELKQQIQLEQVQKKEEQEKKRADDLWSSFMADVGPRKTPAKKPGVVTGGLGSLTSPASKPSPSIPTPASSSSAAAPSSSSPKPSPSTPASSNKPQSTITVTKVYDFAGEAVKVTKELDVNSKEGKAELKKQQEETSADNQDTQKPSILAAGGVKRPGGGGLGGVLEKINKKQKIGTLEKSKIDWEDFKAKEGIDEELKIHNRGKQSYIERMNFLQRSDVRQFEIEKNLRLNTSKR